jgi:malate dehydrogenase (oxaloacetate-decarboxylating)(NADP+)
VLLISHSTFGSGNSASARKMRATLSLVRQREPDLAVDGEMHADAALLPNLSDRAAPDSRLEGGANLLEP